MQQRSSRIFYNDISIDGAHHRCWYFKLHVCRCWKPLRRSLEDACKLSNEIKKLAICGAAKAGAGAGVVGAGAAARCARPGAPGAGRGGRGRRERAPPAPATTPRPAAPARRRRQVTCSCDRYYTHTGPTTARLPSGDTATACTF